MYDHMKINRKIILHRNILLFIFSVILAASCGQKNNNKTIDEEEKPVVKIITAEEVKFNDTFEFTGTCYANREANVGSSLPGKVEKIHYRTGKSVRKGDLLVSMSSEMLILAEVEYRTLEKDYDRVSRLREKGSISEQDYDHVKAKFDAAKAKYDLMKKNTQILAPFDGIVTDLIVQEGENFMFAPSLDFNFSMTSGILKLMQIDPVIVRFSINEKLISQIKTGQEVVVRFDAWPDKSYKGKISVIHPRFNTITRSTEAEVTISNPNSELKPGMFARVIMSGIEKSGCSIPISAIITKKGMEYVWTEVDGKAYLKEIERLAMKNEDAIVLGIDPGTHVITSRKSQLSEGIPVIISNQ